MKISTTFMSAFFTPNVFIKSFFFISCCNNNVLCNGVRELHHLYGGKNNRLKFYTWNWSTPASSAWSQIVPRRFW
jgi:hypothetical protein